MNNTHILNSDTDYVVGVTAGGFGVPQKNCDARSVAPLEVASSPATESAPSLSAPVGCLETTSTPVSIEVRRAEKPPMFHLEIDNLGVMMHTNSCGPMFCLVQPANASRYPCLHELQAAQRKHRVPAGARIISE